MTTFVTSPGGSATVSIANGGKIRSFNALDTTPQVVAAANAARQKIIFHNPGTVDVFIAPSKVLVNGADATLTPSTGALGGCFRVYANGGTLEITGECQGAWQAFAASTSGHPLTVMDSNV